LRINADFSKNALVVPSADAWVRSPESGVERLMLDRIGDEVARATSIVRYAPGSRFARHTHAKGEEFLVLEGTFSDESGDYPRGTYVRNPPGSGHSPHSTGGCRILVKLRQFDPLDRRQVAIDTTNPALWEPLADGHSSQLSLHEFENERVAMLRSPPGKRLPISESAGGVEIFLVDGLLEANGSSLPPETWLRFPDGAEFSLLAVTDSTVWLKQGHLPPGLEADQS
jgi:redox-sensitive bicupin YhaK (pirin superfamily)